MYLTKYVGNDFFKATKTGHLKFGTLSSYRASEAGADVRLTDREEGVDQVFVKEDLVNFSRNLPGVSIRNCTIIGARKASIAIDREVNAYIYCFAKGSYQRAHHKSFNRENNNNVSNYVVFDSGKFLEATVFMAEVISGRSDYTIKNRPVEYVIEKPRAVPLQEIMTPVDIKRAVFSKPMRFKYENEFRFAIISEAALNPLFTANMTPIIQKKFVDAVVESGSL